MKHAWAIRDDDMCDDEMFLSDSKQDVKKRRGFFYLYDFWLRGGGPELKPGEIVKFRFEVVKDV